MPTTPRGPTRRDLLAGLAGAGAAAVLAACNLEEGRTMSPTHPARLETRPTTTTTEEPFAAGTQAIDSVGDTLVHVPPTTSDPAGLILCLHGAGGDAAGGLGILARHADESGLVLLAPTSSGSTWDAMRSGYGPDVERIDQALERVFASIVVDARRVAVAGFSDGASYALGLGLANGDVFGRILAFSPGFVPPAPRTGHPNVFVSHGTGDTVLPIGRTSRRIVPALRGDGYDVAYREFDGGHVVPPEITTDAVSWLGW